MKKLILYLMLIFPCSLMAQIGLKAGVNFANVSKAYFLKKEVQMEKHRDMLHLIDQIGEHLPN